MLEVEGLGAGYGRIPILNGIDFSIARGEIVGVLGHNGMGKTTLLRTLMGEIRATGGSIVFEDEDITRLAMHRRSRLGIGYVPQGRGIFPHMTVRDNLLMGGLINSAKGALDFELIFGYFPFLRERLPQRGGTLSGGQQAMLAIARALINGPDLRLLDEPSDGVQPSIVQEIGGFIQSLNRDKGLTVLIVEQNIDLIQTVAQRAYVLDKGRVVARVTREELLQTDRLAEHLAV